jgi:hypothetical protein
MVDESLPMSSLVILAARPTVHLRGLAFVAVLGKRTASQRGRISPARKMRKADALCDVTFEDLRLTSPHAREPPKWRTSVKVSGLVCRHEDGLAAPLDACGEEPATGEGEGGNRSPAGDAT